MNSPSTTPDRSDATSNNKILLDHHLRRSQTIASVVLGVGGGYTDAVVAAIEVQAAQKVADASSADAIEAVAGLLSRAFGDAEVEADDWARQAITPFWLMQVGRSAGPRGRQLVGDHHDRQRGTRSRARRVLELRSSERSRRRSGG